MASFQAKIGWKSPRKRENKNFRSVPLLHDPQYKIPKKQQRNSKKLKNTVMDSFQAEVGWKSMRKRENKNYRSVPFLPDAQQKIPKKQQNNSKN